MGIDITICLHRRESKQTNKLTNKATITSVAIVEKARGGYYIRQRRESELKSPRKVVCSCNEGAAVGASATCPEARRGDMKLSCARVCGDMPGRVAWSYACALHVSTCASQHCIF